MLGKLAALPFTYDVDARQRWTIPVDESVREPLDPTYFPTLIGIKNLEFTIYRALHAAARYLHVEGKETPDETARGKSMLALYQTLDLYLDFKPAGGCIEPKAKGRLFSGEHRKTSIEQLAYGLALLYLKRCVPGFRISDVLLIDDSGKDPRPDFKMPKAPRLGVEVRARGYRSSLTKTERSALDAKHTSDFDALLGVYLHYGRDLKQRSRTTKRLSKTRLFIADPSNETHRDDGVDDLLLALRRYAAIVEQLGLHAYLRRLNEAIAARIAGVALPDPLPTPFREAATLVHPQRRRFRKEWYVGRVFSTLMADLQRTDDAAEIAFRVDHGDLGMYSFAGINIAVLRLIHNGAWSGLSQYAEQVPQESLPGNVTLLEEGYVIESVFVRPNSPESHEVVTSLGSRIADLRQIWLDVPRD